MKNLRVKLKILRAEMRVLRVQKVQQYQRSNHPLLLLFQRNRGGKYAVQEQEVAHGRGQDYDDGGGFMEYTQP